MAALYNCRVCCVSDRAHRQPYFGRQGNFWGKEKSGGSCLRYYAYRRM